MVVGEIIEIIKVKKHILVGQSQFQLKKNIWMGIK